MRHHHSPDIDSVPELAAVFAELRTEKVPNPPRGYATVERILLPDGSCIHESSQYGFAEVVARWLWSNGYRAGQGTVAAYEANERYLSGECGMGVGWVKCNRRSVAARALITIPPLTPINGIGGPTWLTGFSEKPGTLWACVSSGHTELEALVVAVDRLIRAGWRVGMSKATTVALLDQIGPPNFDYKGHPDDHEWVCWYQRCGKL